MKIAIASGKGGTGKTTLSTNLASFIAESRECILTDLDVEEPNAGLFVRGELVHSEDKFKKIRVLFWLSLFTCGSMGLWARPAGHSSVIDQPLF